MNDAEIAAAAQAIREGDLRRQVEELRAEAEGLRRERDDLKALADKSMCSYCGHVGPKTQEAMNDHILECEKRPEVKILDEVLAERARADAAEARVKTLSEENDRLRGALRGCVDIVDKAGLLNLSNVFRLGHTRFWYVKASDTFDRARAALAALVSSPRPEQEKQQGEEEKP